MLGVLVNAGAVILGGAIGLLLKKGIPQHLSDAVMKGLALCVLYIGIDGALSGENTLIAILSIAIGALLGTLMRLDDGVTALGNLLEAKFKRKDGSGKASLAEGFVAASLLFCVGAMTVVGSLQSGLQGDHTTLFTKSLIDGIAAIIFASGLGVGVLFSSLFVFVFQGSIVLLSGLLQPLLSDHAVAEMTCVGSLLIIGLSLNMLGLTKLKVMNYLPAVFLPIVFCLFM